MNRELLDTWCERGILFLCLSILIFGPLATGAVRTPDFLVVQALTAGVMLLWGARLWLNPRPPLLWPPICWAVVAFALYAVARYLTSDIEYVARMEMIRVLVYAFLFLAVVNNLHRQEHSQFIVLTLVFLAMGVALYALYQFIAHSQKVWSVTGIFPSVYPGRASGSYISPNNLAGFLEMILPLGLAWVLVGRAKPVLRIVVGYASLAILGGIVVTISRASWVAVGIVLLLFFGSLSLNQRARLPAIVLLLVIVAGGLYFIPGTKFFHVRFRQLSVNGRFSNDARFDLWEPAVRLWQENIWFGVGPNHYNYRFRTYRPETEQLQPDRAHNDYLNTLTDWGLVGAGIVASAWVLLYAGVFQTLRAVRGAPGDLGGRQSNRLALLLGGSCGLLAILIHSTLDFNMHIPANAIVAVTLMALLTGNLRFATERYWTTPSLWLRALLSVVIVAGAGYLAWQGVHRFRENAWLQKAALAPPFSDAKIQALSAAVTAEPMNADTAYAIAEAFHIQSRQGGRDYEKLAADAMDWFKRSMKLNPYDGYNYLGYGMCLDWLERFKEAEPFLDRAVQLDPNGSRTAAMMARHYFETGNYAACRVWAERSIRLHWQNNRVGESYLKMATERLQEAASNNASGSGALAR